MWCHYMIATRRRGAAAARGGSGEGTAGAGGTNINIRQLLGGWQKCRYLCRLFQKSMTSVIFFYSTGFCCSTSEQYLHTWKYWVNKILIFPNGQYFLYYLRSEGIQMRLTFVTPSRLHTNLYYGFRFTSTVIGSHWNIFFENLRNQRTVSAQKTLDRFVFCIFFISCVSLGGIMYYQ